MPTKMVPRSSNCRDRDRLGKESIVGSYKRGTPLERFDAKVDKNGPGGCWLWTASTTTTGYAQLRIGDRMKEAHRWYYQQVIGPIPAGMYCDHICRVRHCVNPEHIRLVTNKENAENRATDEGRGFRGVSYHGRGKWVARVGHNRQLHYVGYFSSEEEAAEAARQKRLELHTHNEADR